MKRRQLTPFSLSFLDVMCCGFGAVVLLVLILNNDTVRAREQTFADLRAEAVRSLREARETLRRVPDGAGMWPTPFRPAWEARFRAASGALARVREQMSQVDGVGAEQTADAAPRARSRTSEPAGAVRCRARSRWSSHKSSI